MARYIKKPVVIEAIQFMGMHEDGHACFSGVEPDWLETAFAKDNIRVHPVFPDTRLQVETSEGCMIADANDWIIKGVKDELYPCKPDVFDLSYRPADEDIRGWEEPVPPQV